MKKSCCLILSALVFSIIFSGCKIDINKLLGESVQTENSAVSSIQSIDESESDLDSEDSAFYDSVPEEPQSESDSEEEVPESNASFDTTAYQTVYISGAPTVQVIDSSKAGSKVVGELSSGESVSFISSNGTGYSFIYSETLAGFGYVDSYYFVYDSSEVASGETYYIKEDNTPVYIDQYCSSEINYLSKNDTVNIIAKVSNGYWLTQDNNGTFGYINFYSLSEEKIKKNTSSKSSSKTESKIESTVESQTETNSENTVESTSENSLTVGWGEEPTSGYTVYKVNVESGYLALRSDPSSGDNIIGELYTGDIVYVLDASNYYRYVYSPTLGMYGYVNGDYLLQ